MKTTMLAGLAAALLIGTITDRTTAQPMPGVHVTAGKAHATTGADGTFRLTGLAPGPVTLGVESDDVPPQRFAAVVKKSTTRADLRVCSTTLDYNCGPMQ